MMVLELFLGFLKVGCFAFGGAYAAIPLIRDIVLSHGWIDEELLTYMIAVSESTPGPIMVNLATYVGSTKAGFFGAIAATLAVVLPSFVTILLMTAALKTAGKNRYVQAVLRGLKPCMVGIILATGCFMMGKNCGFFGQGAVFSLRAAGITALLALVFFGSEKVGKKKLSPITLIVISACLGALVYAF
ncbi:MAG: chromate transporter [Clostridia bacterium]|nr:chromate transporter [Clostridia bacterium]